MNQSILITGANIGLGKETARQLALKVETKKVILFCRSQAKAEAAKKDLEEQTGKKIFEIIIGDVSDVVGKFGSYKRSKANGNETRFHEYFFCR